MFYKFIFKNIFRSIVEKDLEEQGKIIGNEDLYSEGY